MIEPEELQGAKFAEIVGILNAVADEGEWRLNGRDQFLAEGNISGIGLRLRHAYHDKGLTNLSISGNGWLVGFSVTRQRPRTLADDVHSGMADLRIIPELARKSIANARHPANMVRATETKKLCLFKPSFLSPEAFQKDMTLLRMFSSEWE